MHKRVERKLRLSAHWECHECSSIWFMCRKFKVKGTVLFAYLCNRCLYSELLYDEGLAKEDLDILEGMISQILSEEISELEETYIARPLENWSGYA